MSLHLLRQTARKGVEVVVGVSHELPAAQVQVGADGDGEEEPEREPKARDQNRRERQYQHHVHFDFDFFKFDSQNSGYYFENCSFTKCAKYVHTSWQARSERITIKRFDFVNSVAFECSKLPLK